MAKKTTKSKKTKPAAKRSTPGRSTIPRVRQSGPSRFSRYFLPGMLSVVILGAIGALTVLGYQTVTASNFFQVKTIDVAGVDRASTDEIKRIVSGDTQRTGVWNADLPDIRQKIEKLPFVKFAAVSRVLPNGLKVVVTERVPIAVVKVSTGNFLIDADGELLAPPKTDDSSLMIITGWDEAKSEKALKDNQTRIKIFQKMVADWGEFGLAKRVKSIDLADLQEPKATIEDSGKDIPITLARDNYAKSLKSAIEAIAGKGDKVRSVDSAGIYPVIDYVGVN
ncbi:MAG TPA: FtsQ-type POTRA domain-containing protein [Pyrinomonadaceae bacterium]|nr:FtsQ-type POTRA domain-containing protein [Pyrinomonadaceae bacterium]